MSNFLLMSKVCVWERCLGFRSKRRGCRLFLCRGIMPLSHFDHCFLGVRQSKKSSICRTFLDYCRQIFVSYSVLGSGSSLLLHGEWISDGLLDWILICMLPMFEIRHVEFLDGRSLIVEIFPIRLPWLVAVLNFAPIFRSSTCRTFFGLLQTDPCFVICPCL